MERSGTIAMIAHDQKKDEMVAFAKEHAATLETLSLVTTGTTGTRILEAVPSLSVRKMKSGPLGGDQQIGSLIADGQISALFFFVDPLTAMPHDVDIKALIRLSALYDIPAAFNRRTAEILIASLGKDS